jgi:membrane protein
MSSFLMVILLFYVRIEAMTNGIKKISDFFTRRVWEIDTSPLSKFRTYLINTIRLLSVAIHDFTEGQLTLRAMSLVYTTLLSIVPVLAISFSVLKAFGVHNDMVAPFLTKFLDPLGAKGAQITSQIIGFVENMKVGVLGSIGLAMLFYTVVSVIQKVEKSFNAIWGIKKPRSLARRFSDYVSVILVGPVLMFSAIGLTATFTSNTIVKKVISIEPFGTFFYYTVELMPYIMVCSAFTFLYVFIPNTKVQLKSAMVGGLIAGVLWEFAGWGFATFTVSSAKYAAIYSGFAILVMFLIWLYLSWLILLVGAQIAYYHQYPQFLYAKKEMLSISNRLRERVALLIMYFVSYNFYHNREPWTLHALVDHLKLPVDPIQEALILLEHNNLLQETGDDPPAFFPARDISTITINELLQAVRIADVETLAIENNLATVPEIDEVISTIDLAVKESLQEKTLKDIVQSLDKDM